MQGSYEVDGTSTPIQMKFQAMEDLKKAPSFSGAQSKKGPPVCWFSRDARVVFAGCNSQATAGYFAKSFLRKGAQAIGTTENIGAGGGYISWQYDINIENPTKWMYTGLTSWLAVPVWRFYSGAL
jgi:hypothetical protein